jgi:hypothetical protein
VAERFVATFDNFAGGYTSLDQLHSVGPNRWRGRNVVVAADGSILPRKGLYKAPITMGSITGRVRAFGLVPGLSNNFWFLLGGTFYRTTILPKGSSPASVTACTGATVPTNGDNLPHVTIGADSYVLVPPSASGVGVYKVSPMLGTATPIANTPKGTAILQHGGRLIVASGSVVMVSAYNDFTQWSKVTDEELSGELFPIGDPQWAIAGMVRVGDVIYVTKDPEGVFAIYGTAPRRWAIRKIASGHGTNSWTQIGEWRSRMMAWSPSQGDGSPLIVSTTIQPLLELRDALRPTTADLLNGNGSCSTEPISNTAVVKLRNRVLVNRLPGSWTYHEFTNVGGDLIDQALVTPLGKGETFLMRGASGTPAVFVWESNFTDSPGSTANTDRVANPGDDSNTPVDAEVNLPEFVDKEGRDFQVREVLVDLLAYDTGVANNELRIQVIPTSWQGQGNTPSAPAHQEWVEAGSAATAAGVRRHIRFPFGNGIQGASFRIVIPRMRGVRILRVRAICEAQSARVR